MASAELLCKIEKSLAAGEGGPEPMRRARRPRGGGCPKTLIPASAEVVDSAAAEKRVWIAHKEMILGRRKALPLRTTVEIT